MTNHSHQSEAAQLLAAFTSSIMESFAPFDDANANGISQPAHSETPGGDSTLHDLDQLAFLDLPGDHDIDP